MKQCTRCCVEQSLDSFKIDPRYAGGRTSWCRGCINEYRRNRRENNPERVSYDSMIDRCNNPNNPRYHRYGGRGISICDRWMASFDNFLEDMGPRPKGHSIDRIDNDGDYRPENCKWSSAREQYRNRSTTSLIEHDGLSMSEREWERFANVGRGTFYNKRNQGLTTQEIIERILEVKND